MKYCGDVFIQYIQLKLDVWNAVFSCPFVKVSRVAPAQPTNHFHRKMIYILGMVLFLIVPLQIKSSEIPLKCSDVINNDRVNIYDRRCDNSARGICEYSHRDIISMRMCQFTFNPGVSIFSGNYRSLSGSKQNLVSLEHFHVISSTLELFDISDNQLMEIPFGYFKNTPNIRVIDLSFNEFKDIISSTFAGANRLTAIFLSNNRICDIHAESFVNLLHLEFVSLKNNCIKVLNYEFSDQKRLNTLHLEKNAIESLTGSDLILDGRVRNVHLSWNQVKYLHLPEGNQFNAILDSHFESIHQTSNHQYEIHCKHQSFSTLVEFKASPKSSDNVLQLLQCLNGPSVKSLDLSGNIIGQLTKGSFNRFDSVKQLYLRNVQLTNFDFDVLKNNRHIRSLDISFNNLTSVQNPSILKYMSMMNEFYAVGNQLNNTSEIMEYLNPSIEILDLSDSKLNMNSKLFQSFTKLKHLALKNTSILSIDFDPFREMRNLIHLDLSDNDFSNINFQILSTTLGNLEVFQCADCKITNISNVIQFLGKKLTELDLSGNVVDSVVFNGSHLNNLECLILRRMNFKTIEIKPQLTMNKLEHLDISYNRLQKVDLVFLPTDIEEVNLEGNEISQIDFVASHFPRITLKIANNCLHIAHLERMMQNKRNLFKDNWWNQNKCEFEPNAINQERNVSQNINIYIGTGTMILIAIAFGICIFYMVRHTRKYTSQSILLDIYEYFTIKIPAKRTKHNTHLYENVDQSAPVYAVVDKSKKKKNRRGGASDGNANPLEIATGDDLYDEVQVIQAKMVEIKPQVNESSNKQSGSGRKTPTQEDIIYSEPYDHLPTNINI